MKPHYGKRIRRKMGGGESKARISPPRHKHRQKCRLGNRMKLNPVPFDSKLDVYQRQAEELLGDWRNGNPEALETIRHNHPGFLREDIKWLPRDGGECS